MFVAADAVVTVIVLAMVSVRVAASAASVSGEAATPENQTARKPEAPGTPESRRSQDTGEAVVELLHKHGVFASFIELGALFQR